MFAQYNLSKCEHFYTAVGPRYMALTGSCRSSGRAFGQAPLVKTASVLFAGYLSGTRFSSTLALSAQNKVLSSVKNVRARLHSQVI